MKLAIPSESDKGLKSVRSGHFGHTPYFTIVTIEDGEVKSVEVVKNVDHDTVGCGGVIDFAQSLGFDAILTAGMGQPPFMRFTQAGIAVYIDAQEPYVGAVIDKFIAGKVGRMSFEDVCAHH